MQQGAPEPTKAKFRGTAHTVFKRQRGPLYALLLIPALLPMQVLLWMRIFGIEIWAKSVWVIAGGSALLVGATGFVVIHSIVTNSAARRAFVKSKGRTCTTCLYDLNGMGETGTCPECAHSFDVATDAKAWKLDAIVWPGDEGR